MTKGHQTVSYLAILLVSFAFHEITYAQQPIKVLLARGSTSSVTTADLVEALDDANTIMDNTFDELPAGTYKFESVMVGGGPLMASVSCPSGTTEAVSACAILALEGMRNTHNADIVLLAVDILTDECASVLSGMLDASTISILNRPLGYAVAEKDCLFMDNNGRYPTAHEFGHLLSLEHHDNNTSGKPKAGIPPDTIEYNHAAEHGFWTFSVMGGLEDCQSVPLVPCSLLGADWHPFFSEAGRTFPSGGSAGDTSYSNSKKVIKDHSWDVVASYRPIGSSANLYCDVVVEGCEDGNTIWTYTFGSINQSSVPISGFFAEYSRNNGPWTELISGSTSSCSIMPTWAGDWLTRVVATVINGPDAICEVSIEIPGFCTGGLEL